MGRNQLAVVVAVASVVVLSWVLADRPILDTDYFWHLRTGALIAATGRVPMLDPYSYSAQGARWVDLHWLFQLAVYHLHQLGGHEANRIAGVALGLGVVAVSALGFWRSDRPAVCALALALLVVTACVRFLVRPDTVSLLLAAAVLGLLRRDEQKNDGWVFAIAPIQLLWANIHAFQAVGVALVGMALFGELTSSRLSGGSGMRRDRVLRLGAVLALAVGAALVNPNGLDGALFPLRQLGMIGPAETRGVFGYAIDELRSPFAVMDANNAPALAAFTLLTLLSLAALILDRERFSVFDALVWLSFLWLALSAVRNIALFAVGAAPIFATHLGHWLDGTPRLAPSRQSAIGAATLAGLGLVTCIVVGAEVARGEGPRGSASPALAAFWFPERAVDWIERERPPGPLYHRMGDGGFLIWRLWPSYQVLSDGRLEVYGEDLYTDLEVAGDGGPETFRRLDERHHFGTAIVHFGLFRDLSLFQWLSEQPDWKLTQLDEVAAVFVHVAPGEASRWLAVNVDSPLLFEPLDAAVTHPLDLWRRRSRISIYLALGRNDAAWSLLEDTRQRYRDPVLEEVYAKMRRRPPP